MKLPDRETIVQLLKEVKDPETGLSVYELALVKSIDYIEPEKKIVIRMDLKKRDPSCPGCIPIAWYLQKAIMDELARWFLKFDGIKLVEFQDTSLFDKSTPWISKLNVKKL